MMVKNILRYSFIGTSIIMILAFARNHFYPDSQKNRGLVLIDTTAFAPNAGGGWAVLSSYLNQEIQDSVDFELILTQRNNVNWKTEQFIGTITKVAFLPKKNQQVTFALLPENIWNIRVDTKGLCYVTQLNGPSLVPSTLQGSPFILPLKVRYRSN